MDFLEKSGVPINFCYQHNAQFPNKESYLEHRKECVLILKTPYKCSFVDDNGQMCKEEYRNSSGLILHTYIIHGEFLCDECGVLNETMYDLESHDHDRTTVLSGK